MNGFTPEAEHLGAAHGIQTVSYADQPLMRPIEADIAQLSAAILSSLTFADHAQIQAFLTRLNQLIQGKDEAADWLGEAPARHVLALRRHLDEIETSLIVTAKGGTYLHVLSQSPFPLAQFAHSDEGTCQIHMEKQGRRRHYYFTVNEGKARFYFTRPAYLSVARLLGTAMAQQQSLFAQDLRPQGFLQLCVRADGVMRFLRLRIDPRLRVD